MGQLIHNNQVIEYLESLGIKTVLNPKENIEGICIIRTHGTTPQIIDLIKQKGCEVLDATCPDVKRVQDKARLLASKGYQVVIIGKPDHPEVIAIKANAELGVDKEALVISSCEEANNYIETFKTASKIGIVIQTTQKKENFIEILQIISKYAKELKFYNTICNATCKRQEAAKNLAKKVDLMIVAGSKSSANTTHLAEIIGKNTKTIHIETKEELKNYQEIIINAKKIGVTAGASTPENVINDILTTLRKEN